MSPMPQAAIAAMPIEPASITAYDPASIQAGSGMNASPEAMGRALLSGLDHFNTHETQFRDAVQQAAGAGPADAASGAAGIQDGPVSAIGEADGVTASASATQGTAMQQGAALQQKSMGLMMQTYSFALEATLVTNAATTFTSSINTLIKTQ